MTLINTLKTHPGIYISLLLHLMLFGLLLHFKPEYRNLVKEYVELTVFEFKKEVKEELDEHLITAPRKVKAAVESLTSAQAPLRQQADYTPSPAKSESDVIKEYVDHQDIGIGGVGALPERSGEGGAKQGYVYGDEGGTSTLGSARFDQGLWDDYGNEIRKRCLRRLHYPSMAARNGWQGETEILISISKAGLITTSIHRSANYKVLDMQALKMVKESVAEIELPKKYQGKDLNVIIPVAFILGSEG